MKPKKILVVDNHPMILTFMTELLEKQGHQVLTAGDGLGALEIMQHTVPDIAFIDLIMPNIDGKKLCQIIRKTPKLRDVKLVVLSAVAAEDNMNLYGLKADVCIAKGPLGHMGRHVLAALDRLDISSADHAAVTVAGLEGIHKREITKELLSEKRHLEVILDSMAEGILELTHDGKVVYANPAGLSLTTRPEKQLLAYRFVDLFSDDDRTTLEALFDVAGGRTQPGEHEPVVRLEGRHLNVKVLSLEAEETRKSVVILNDVTEQKMREVQLQQARKMESIGTLAAGIAHDFNNLLMGIQGYASLMLLSTDSSHSFFDMLKGIETQVKRGSKLTGQLLGYARKGKYEIRPIDINRLVKETSETFGRTKKEITIHHRLAENIFAVEADREQIDQTLLNLYVNAADAMPGGGDLFLKTANTTHDKMKRRFYNPTPGNYVMISITDTGPGIDASIVDKIFDPFFSTKETGKGTGLGLASAYGIIKGHGGYIDVESEKGSGTTFSIYLPATSETPKREQGVAAETPRTTSGKLGTVLLVDDEDTARDVGKRMLEAMGYSVFLAGDGIEAIEIYRINQEKIDIVMLDIVMPKMGGGETFDRLREINPDLKVILSSGYSIDGEASEILDRGCNGFIQKPFDLKVLASKLKAILETE
jgi:PAS domain S-box-containing protein